jgi:4,5-DOPA dioxygenase extradiol
MPTAPMPSLFLSHGAPTLALDDSPAGRFLDTLAATLPRPRAIVVASAHFDTAGTTLGCAAEFPTLHDFNGFAPALHAVRYPARGDAGTAQRARTLLAGDGIESTLDVRTGLDHGAWVPLLRMYPEAEIPVVALSIDSARDAAWHFSLGRALAPLRDDGVLVIGSGGFSHNLRELDWRGARAGSPEWMRAFTEGLRARLLAGDVAGALDWSSLPDAARNHPSPEHLLPLFVALGSAGDRAEARWLHGSVEMGALALDAFAFG